MALTFDTFRDRTHVACTQAVDFCRRYALQPVPQSYVLRVVPNASCDENLRPGEVVFPEDSLGTDAFGHDLFLGPMTAAEFAAWAWRDGRVPEWIDVNAVEVIPRYTVLSALVCGRFTDRSEDLYHLEEGIPPFHILSPVLPPDYSEDSAGDGPLRFDVNWSVKRYRALRGGQ